MRSTTPTSSTSPVNTSNSSFATLRGCIDRHLVVAECLRVHEAPAFRMLERCCGHGAERRHRACTEDDRCTKDNQSVDQTLLNERRAQRGSALHEEVMNAIAAQCAHRIAEAGRVHETHAGVFQ